ncbi:RNase PH-like protein [Encephalitozoon hellem ATCC 50504]|uniref:Exosome RNA binding protein RRP41 n=1 Tax=Encephalitozoon hellem TaxID=27973 RepID=A0A9Q9C9R3_ENCHE|nr:RNase PH-like protein [Encephalitozoon hellem ATCC 50504]AFM99121.1 RNase PH-like protein [Encephalitozoon hellem ATCC 50504]UTX44105.1 exosome RNA binding protein RRP46 [Encephalitozoon hellem]WEL39594.1 exosome RNA binding protein RRP41 [Encephalitozoon hellem]|eukprot:XP_003888102.1 RNase PH-like protein [Encephalitozoon hellem ATCC 50504]
MSGIRSMISVIPHCTGSSRFSYNNTTVFCTVHGPSDATSRQEDPEKAFLDVRWKDMILINGRIYDKYFSKVIERVLSKNIILELDACRTIQVGFNVVGETRNALFCAVNAALLALADGGIPLKSMFYASSSFMHEEEVIIFDGEGNIVDSHAFEAISGENIDSAKDFLKYVKEVQVYTLRSKFPFPIV